MKKYKICQSCTIPLKKDPKPDYEGKKYCSYCYKDGEFLQPNITLEEMKEFLTDVLVKELRVPRFLAKFMAQRCNQIERWKK